VESPPSSAAEVTLSGRTHKIEHGETTEGFGIARMSLVAYSSTPSLVDDSSGLLDESDAACQDSSTPSLRSGYFHESECYITKVSKISSSSLLTSMPPSRSVTALSWASTATCKS
jgi:hypothetical protein